MSAAPNPRPNPKVVTFGCRLNTYESEVMRGHAAAAGLDDAVIVNTCAVTAEAERQARQTIRRLRRENPAARIVVTGCAAQVHAETFAAMPEVDRVLGNQEKMSAAHWLTLEDRDEKVVVDDIMTVRETAEHLVEGFEGRARAFVLVQQGCDHRCTFCIIPYARGNNRSVPLGRIVDQVRALVAQGYAEVVLTGVDITGYGPDLPGGPTLGQACRRLLAAVPELKRLRLSSLDPVEIDAELYALIENEPRLLPHFHLSAQAGDDMILKRMKRRHSRADILDAAARIQRLRPGAALGADVIAGFPTETEAMFRNTLALVRDAGLTHLHVFPYSARAGTPAARMPQLDGGLVKERAGLLRAEGARALAAFLAAHAGGETDVLIEGEHKGHTDSYLPITVPGAPDGIHRVRVTDATDTHLSGELVS